MSLVASVSEAPWRAGLRGARANLVPGLLLQLGALALVLGYYQSAAWRDTLAQLTAWRTAGGLAFPVFTTGLFGGLLPLLFLKSSPRTRTRYTWRQGAALTAFWAYKGAEIDVWYRLLAWAFGEGHDARTIVLKMLADQFVYCPLFAIPISALVYEWTETRFSRTALARDLRAGAWLRRRVLPLLLSNLGVWIPAVCIIYALPTPLQLPLQNLVLCFFTLLVAHQVKHAPCSAPSHAGPLPDFRPPSSAS